MKSTVLKTIGFCLFVVTARLSRAQSDLGDGLGLLSEITSSAPLGGITLTHTVWNPGPGSVPNVWLTNRLPVGVSFLGTNKWPFPGGPGPTSPPPPDPPLLLSTITPGNTFAAPSVVTNPPAVAIAITDLNRDGWPDLVVAGGTNNSPVTVYFTVNSTNIPLSVPTILPTVNPPKLARTIAVGDLNGDGLPDVICADALGSGLWTYLQSSGVPGGTNFVLGPTFALTGVITAIEVMDFDGDGFDDLVALEPAKATLHLLLNTTASTGVPGFTEVDQLPTSPNPTALGKEKKRPGRESPTLASLGRLFVTTDGGGGTVSVYIPSGSTDPANLFLPRMDVPCGPTPRAIGVVDLDGDGLEDLVVANGPARTLTLLSQSATGGYSPAGSLLADGTTSCDALHVLDLNGDGRPEIITGSAGLPDCIVIPNSRTPNPLSQAQFGGPVHFALTAPFQNLAYDTYRDGSQAGGFIAIGHTGPGGGATPGGESFSVLLLTQPGARVAVPLGDLAPGAATGVSLDLEVRVFGATNALLATGGGVNPVGPIRDPIPLRSICGKLFCVSGGVTQGMGGFLASVVISGPGYYYSNSAVTLANGTYCVDLPFECGGIFPINTIITVTSTACPGQVLNVPLWTYFQTATLPSLYCGNCNACTNVQNTMSLFSGSAPSGLLPLGALDSQFTTGNPPFANANPYVTGPDTGWLADGPNSRWIGPDLLFKSSAGVYCYTNSFYLPCTNSAWLQGQWTLAGAGGSVLLNGAATGISLSGFGLETSWHPFSLTSGFVAGWNTLVFCVTNPPSSVGLSYNPTGLRTEITGTAHCCAGCAEIHCPTNMVVEICTNGPAPYGVVVNYPPPAAFSHCGVITNLVCVPPSGGFFPLGTNLIVCTTSDSLGNSATCSFKVIVLPDFTPPIVQCPPVNTVVTGCPPLMPNFTTNVTAVDNCSTPAQITVTQAIPPGTPLPGGQTVVVIHVCDAAGNCRDCDVIINAVPTGGNPTITCPANLVLLTCTTSAVANFTVLASNYTGTVVCMPPSGSVFPLGATWVTCTATNTCGGVATCSFSVTVRPPPGRWNCWQVGIGIPFTLVNGATTSFHPVDTGGVAGTTLSLLPVPGATNSGLLLQPGTASAITFTTVLDFTAPVGAGFDLVLPPDPAHPNQPTTLSVRNKGKKGYCVKTQKFYDDSPSALMRGYPVNTNGDLLDPLSFTFAEVDANGVFDIGFQPGVTNCHITIDLDLKTGTVSVEFPGPIVPATDRKGWDGCIYGPDRPIKKPTSRVTVIPPAPPGVPPITDRYLYASGVAELPIEDPSLSTQSASKPPRRWGDGHVTLIKAYDDDSVEFLAGGDGGGVHVDLGTANSFDLRLTKFETNALPGEELLTRTLGPIRGLTNRPPPPFLDACLLKASSAGVEGSADFSNLDSPTVRVQVLSGGVLVAERVGVAAELGHTLFTLPTWPEQLGKLGGPTPCRRIKIKQLGLITLPASGGLPPQEVIGDECRVLAETPPGTPHPDCYSGFEFIATAGADWGVSNLLITPACTPVPLVVTRGPAGITATWVGDGFRLQGAVTLAGPWLDLGVGSPVTLPPNHPARYFRLLCN